MSNPKPRYYGKILGGLLGFALLRHPIGLLLGAVLGHALDSGWLRRPGAGPSRNEADEPHATLGVKPDASDAEIDQAYRRLMARYHPDRFAGASADAQAEAGARASAVNAAYDRIMAARRRGR